MFILLKNSLHLNTAYAVFNANYVNSYKHLE